MFKTLPALAAVVVATALVVPTVSHAAEKSSMRVSYADLNLATDFGQQQLQRRVVFAARLVCGTAATHVDLTFEREVAGCRSGAVADAQPAYPGGRSVKPVTLSVEVLDGAALIVTAQ